jgi:hypothetical protein
MRTVSGGVRRPGSVGGPGSGWRRAAGQRVVLGGIGPTGVGSPEAALRVEEGAGNFGSLLASKCKILRLGFKR